MSIHELAKYNTSRDYEKLADLMQKESIICTVQYHECRDCAQTLYSDSRDGGGVWQISARGFGYIYAFNRAEFIEQCTKGNVEFMAPPESAIGNLPADIPAQEILDPTNIPDEIFTAAVKLGQYAARQGWKDWLFMGLADRRYTERILAERAGRLLDGQLHDAFPQP